MDHDIRDRIAAQLASPQWALMRRSPNVTDERGVGDLTDQPATFDQRFPSRSFQLEHPIPPLPPATRLGVDAGAGDLDVADRDHLDAHRRR